MSEHFACPRRTEGGPLAGTKPGDTPDRYRAGHGVIGQKRGCTYCGSMAPDDFLQAVRDGVEIGPTDKSYKAYIGQMSGKFYFQHLSEDQKHEFIDLLNAGTVNIGYPGHFYVLPFFIARPA